MLDWLMWFTRMENSKVFSLVLFFTLFCLIVIYVYGNRRRSRRLESYKFMPFDDESDEQQPDSNGNETHEREK